MDYEQAQALAQLEEHRPEVTRSILYDSGYGDLADQWLTASSEFEVAAREAGSPGPSLHDGGAISTDVLRAYARMCLSWSRISRLREQAQGCIERVV